MVIYIDVLIFTNTIIDFLILNITSLILKRSFSVLRLIFAAVIGGLSSMYILCSVESNIIDITYQLLIALVMITVSCGIKNIKNLLYGTAVFLGLSFGLNGLVTILGRKFGDLIITDNLEYYINISPILLIIFTIIFYLFVILLHRYIGKKRNIKDARLSISAGGEQFAFSALIDTGNSIQDPFGRSQVFIVNKADYSRMLNAYSFAEAVKRKRVIPVTTVGETLLLDAIRCETAIVLVNDTEYIFESPLVAASEKQINNDYNAIVPYLALDRIPDKGEKV